MIHLSAVLVYVTGVFLSSCSQIVLKREASKTHTSFWTEYLNLPVILGYAVMFGCTLLTLLSYRLGLPMNWAGVLECTGYIFVTALGVLILKERISAAKLGALCVILAGVVLFAVGGSVHS